MHNTEIRKDEMYIVDFFRSKFSVTFIVTLQLGVAL